MTRVLMTACLAVAAIVGSAVSTSRAESVSFNYTQIKYDYKKQDAKGITFGGGSTFPALPADFFGPGSLPFEGVITLQNVPNSGTATPVLMSRNSGATFDPLPVVDVPIEIVALNLASAQPILVAHSGGATTQWNVNVQLDSAMTSGGQLRLSHAGPGDPDGGAIYRIDSFFDIFARVEFTQLGGPGATSLNVADEVTLVGFEAGPGDPNWAHQHNSIAGGANREFVPGADAANPSAPLQVLLFEGGGLDFQLQVVDVVPEPSTAALAALGAALLAVGARRRRHRLGRRRSQWRRIGDDGRS